MCIAMNGDQLSPGQYAVSTSNRNFEGRQGRGGRTLLASPLTAAASAQGACSRDEPVPKLSPASRMLRPAISGWSRTNGGSFGVPSS